MLRQVALDERRRADLEAVDRLRQRARDDDHVAVLRIDFEGERSDVLVAVAEREGVERLPARHVDHLEVLLVCALDVEAAAVARQAHCPRQAGLERDVRAQFLGGFVEDGEAFRARSEIDGAGAAGQLRVGRRTGGDEDRRADDHSEASHGRPQSTLILLDLPAFAQHLIQQRDVLQRRLRRLERLDVGEEIGGLLIREAGGAVARHRRHRSGWRRLVGPGRADERDEAVRGEQTRDERAVFAQQPRAGFAVVAVARPALVREIERLAVGRVAGWRLRSALEFAASTRIRAAPKSRIIVYPCGGPARVAPLRAIAAA